MSVYPMSNLTYHPVKQKSTVLQPIQMTSKDVGRESKHSPVIRENFVALASLALGAFQQVLWGSNLMKVVVVCY